MNICILMFAQLNYCATLVRRFPKNRFLHIKLSISVSLVDRPLSAMFDWKCLFTKVIYQLASEDLIHLLRGKSDKLEFLASLRGYMAVLKILSYRFFCVKEQYSRMYIVSQHKMLPANQYKNRQRVRSVQDFNKAKADKIIGLRYENTRYEKSWSWLKIYNTVDRIVSSGDRFGFV